MNCLVLGAGGPAVVRHWVGAVSADSLVRVFVSIVPGGVP